MPNRLSPTPCESIVIQWFPAPRRFRSTTAWPGGRETSRSSAPSPCASSATSGWPVWPASQPGAASNRPRPSLRSASSPPSFPATTTSRNPSLSASNTTTDDVGAVFPASLSRANAPRSFRCQTSPSSVAVTRSMNPFLSRSTTASPCTWVGPASSPVARLTSRSFPSRWFASTCRPFDWARTRSTSRSLSVSENTMSRNRAPLAFSSNPCKADDRIVNAPAPSFVPTSQCEDAAVAQQSTRSRSPS